jgi:hypothetical protein
MQGSALENKQMMRHNIGGKGGSQLASKGTYEVITFYFKNIITGFKRIINYGTILYRT